MYKPVFEQASPCRYVLLPQIRLEPDLKRLALELNPSGIFYNHEVVSLTEHDGAVSVRYHQGKRRAAGSDHDVRVQYVLGTDGRRIFANQLGISMIGESNVMDSLDQSPT